MFFASLIILYTGAGLFAAIFVFFVLYVLDVVRYGYVWFYSGPAGNSNDIPTFGFRLDNGKFPYLKNFVSMLWAPFFYPWQEYTFQIFTPCLYFNKMQQVIYVGVFQTLTLLLCLYLVLSGLDDTVVFRNALGYRVFLFYFLVMLGCWAFSIITVIYVRKRYG